MDVAPPHAPLVAGIDLGTTHCAVASVDPSRGAMAPVQDVSIVQLVRPGEVAARSLLPSCLYLPAEQELPREALRLPWDDSPSLVAGELARWQGTRSPGRLVASAKSWLCHAGVDRSAPILPWGAPAGVEKLSPVDASAALLSHLARAWEHAHPGAALAEQEVVLTVPASFDEVARALTVTAARRAGLEKLTLLEEPQAAFYDFTARHRGAALARALAGARLVLVVDVGGGTTDFTLVQAELLPEGPALRRLAVGDHLMLGGDNMDAALAHRVEAKLLAGGRRLPAAQWVQLVQAVRVAKEALLGARAPERHGVAVVAEGSRLLGRALSAELGRAEVEELVLEGFFPRSGVDETPRRAPRAALQELGLPYAQDAAITRHLAAFLRRHAEATRAALGGEVVQSGGLPRPDAILLNGGVFNSPALAERLVEVVSAWWPGAERIRLLPHESLDLAVARGAAYYGLVRHGLGLKIRGGAARAFYVGLGREAESEGAPARAVCLVPRGLEEGQAVDLGARSFSLALGRPVQFPLYSTTADRVDRPGDVVEVSEELSPLPPLHTVLRGRERRTGEERVHLSAGLTEIGTLELWCVSDAADERWRLEFELRGQAGRPALAVTESMPARFGEARENIERIYGSKPLPMGPKDVKQLVRVLEKVLGTKEGWRLPVLRELWSALYAGAGKRRRSADHERIFFHLLGFCGRPGFGYPLDEWRCEQAFRLFPESVQFHGEKANWIEFWVLWRRISGGLAEAAQAELWAYLKPHLARRVPPEAPRGMGKLKGVQPEGLDEMVRAAASLEQLPPEEKTELGGWITARLEREPAAGGPWAWALGRLGARAPVAGTSHRVVAPEVAEEWLGLLVRLGVTRVDGAPFAVAQLARMTGDRARDVGEEARAKASEALRGVRAPEAWARMVEEVVTLAPADEARALGDTLPAGLTLV